MNMVYPSTYLCLFYFLSAVFRSFQCKYPEHFFNKFIPMYFMLLDVTINGIFNF